MSRSVREAGVFQFDQVAVSHHYDPVALVDPLVQADRSAQTDQFVQDDRSVQDDLFLRAVLGDPPPAARSPAAWWVRQMALVDRSVRLPQASLAVLTAGRSDLVAPDVRFDRRYD